MAKASKRNELNEAFIAALAADWNKNGSDVITALRVTRPEIYAQLIGKLVPTKIETSDASTAFDNMTAEEIESWLVANMAEDLEAAERMMEKARELAASGDPIVTIIPDEPAPTSTHSKSRFGALPVVKG